MFLLAKTSIKLIKSAILTDVYNVGTRSFTEQEIMHEDVSVVSPTEQT